MFIIKLDYQGSTFYLRSTVWTAEQDRATRFDSPELAQAQLDRAKKFMKTANYKAAKITESN